MLACPRTRGQWVGFHLLSQPSPALLGQDSWCSCGSENLRPELDRNVGDVPGNIREAFSQTYVWVMPDEKLSAPPAQSN
jgi:hypothetical protein